MNNLNCWVSLHSTQPTYFIGGEGAYQDLLNIFERIGIELRPEIDNYFKKYN